MKNKILVSVVTVIFVSLLLSFEGFAANKVTVVHNRTKDEVVHKHMELSHSGFTNEATRYKETPVLKAPYFAGSLNDADVADAINALKMVRFLAGVPYENVEFTDEYNNISQHGAVLLAASNQFTHYPGKPSDMSDEFFEIGYKGCSMANLSAGRNNISAAVIGFVFDSGANNMSSVGHRRWVLSPGGTEFGIGYAVGSGASYGGSRISMCVPMDVWDEADSYVAWPSSGAFPIQYFSGRMKMSDSAIVAPWSINLGADYSTPSEKTVEVRLTRKRDGKQWIFNSETPDLGTEENTNSKLHFAIENSNYGLKRAIIFRPDLDSLGAVKDGDTFTVEVSGIKLKDGTSTTLEYEVEFFDLAKAVDEYKENAGTDSEKNGTSDTEGSSDTVDTEKAEEMTAYIPPFPVTMNDVTVNNENLKYPFILYKNITYFPMTYYDSRFLGIATSYTPLSGLIVLRYTSSPTEYRGETGSANPASFPISIATGKITVNGKTINNSEEEYPLLLFRDVTYFPMTWRFAVEEFGWSYSFDTINGLVINTRK